MAHLRSANDSDPWAAWFSIACRHCSWRCHVFGSCYALSATVQAQRQQILALREDISQLESKSDGRTRQPG